MDNIADIQREESKSIRSATKIKIVPLESDFYKEVMEYMQSLEQARDKINDRYSTEYAILDDEVRSKRIMIEKIFELRRRKIVNLALLERTDKKDVESMTPEERRFYETTLDLIKRWRLEILDPILKPPVREPEKKPEPKEPANTIRHEEQPASDENLEGNGKLIQEKDNADKKDICKECIVVRMLQDVPSFIGVDGRDYTLAKDDVAVLPIENSKALINRNAAVVIRCNL